MLTPRAMVDSLVARVAGQRQLPRALAAVAGVVLLLAVVAVGVQVGGSDADDAAPSPSSEGTTTTVGSAPGTAAPPQAPPPAGLPPVPAVQGPNGVAAGARSVAYQGGLAGLESIKLRGGSLDFTGQVVDGSGARRRGTVRSGGPELHVAGKGLDVTVVGQLRVKGTGARIDGLVTVAAAGNVTAAAATFSLQPTPAPGSSSAAAEPTPIPGPVTLVSEPGVAANLVPHGEAEWLDAPAVLRLVGKGRTTLSWGGPGVVRADGRDHRAEFLGVKASALDATVERVGAGVRVRGTATFLQVYADGLPVLAGKGRMRVKSTPGHVARGTNGSFTWAPENDGKTDFVMTRIRPGNAEAAWVSLGLDKLAPMCGGEPCPVRGGDTSGLRRGRGINAVIMPGTGDERDIRFLVPDDAALGRHQIVVTVEGNFEPIRVVVEFEVVATPPTTTTRP